MDGTRRFSTLLHYLKKSRAREQGWNNGHGRVGFIRGQACGEFVFARLRLGVCRS